MKQHNYGKVKTKRINQLPQCKLGLRVWIHLAVRHLLTRRSLTRNRQSQSMTVVKDTLKRSEKWQLPCCSFHTWTKNTAHVQPSRVEMGISGLETFCGKGFVKHFRDSRAFYLCLAESAILLVLDGQKGADFRKKRKRCSLLVGPGQIYFYRNASSIHGFDSSTEDNHNGNRARYRGQPQQKQSSLRRTTESTTTGTELAIEDYHNENRARCGGLPQRKQSSP